MKGLIFVNPYLLPKESVEQAKTLQKEFCGLNVNVEIIDDGYLHSMVKDGSLLTEYVCDFAVFLDKDKYLSNLLSKCGVKLFNSHNAVRVCDDKAETYMALAGSGLNLPKTIFGALCYDKNAKIKDGSIEKIIDELGLPVVVKESFGSMGKGVHLAESKNELEKTAEQIKCKPHLFQEYLGARKGVDVRIIVIGGKAVGAMERFNKNDFRSNVALGGQCRKVDVKKDFSLAAEKASEILGLDYCGVDILYGNNGEPYICEVNSNAFFFGFTKATGIDVAKIYANYIVEKTKKSQ